MALRPRTSAGPRLLQQLAQARISSSAQKHVEKQVWRIVRSSNAGHSTALVSGLSKALPDCSLFAGSFAAPHILLSAMGRQSPQHEADPPAQPSPSMLIANAPVTTRGSMQDGGSMYQRSNALEHQLVHSILETCTDKAICETSSDRALPPAAKLLASSTFSQSTF